MKLNELITTLVETTNLGNAKFTVRYVNQTELTALMAKNKFVGASHHEAFGYNSNAGSLSGAEHMATMLSDIPATASKAQMLKITQLMDTGWDEDIVYTLLSFKPADIQELYNRANPAPADPTKRPILVTTYGAWTEEVVVYHNNNAEDEDEDDFEEDYWMA